MSLVTLPLMILGAAMALFAIAMAVAVLISAVHNVRSAIAEREWGIAVIILPAAVMMAGVFSSVAFMMFGIFVAPVLPATAVAWITAPLIAVMPLSYGGYLATLIVSILSVIVAAIWHWVQHSEQ